VGHTAVDLGALESAMRLLAESRSVVGKAAERLKEVPFVVGREAFGTFDQGEHVATKHAAVVEGVSQGLATGAQGLEAAVAATAQVIENYRAAEQANTTGIKALDPDASAIAPTVGGGF
jgi:hypothetical protein